VRPFYEGGWPIDVGSAAGLVGDPVEQSWVDPPSRRGSISACSWWGASGGGPSGHRLGTWRQTDCAGVSGAASERQEPGPLQPHPHPPAAAPGGAREGPSEGAGRLTDKGKTIVIDVTTVVADAAPKGVVSGTTGEDRTRYMKRLAQRGRASRNTRPNGLAGHDGFAAGRHGTLGWVRSVLGKAPRDTGVSHITEHIPMVNVIIPCIGKATTRC
jgi:hypothetical protein